MYQASTWGIPPVLHLQNLWLLKQVQFLYKTDTVHKCLGQFNTNYIIFREVEEINIVLLRKNKESDGKFGYVSLVKN
jgi:hypothetical protein